RSIMKWHEIVGAIHIHSTDSDGAKTIPEIARIGDRTGLDFLLFSDHMTLKSYQAGLEGFYGKTLVVIGYEIHDKENKNHYLAFNLNDVLPFGLSPSEYVRHVKEKKGIGIIAHPDEIRTDLPKYPAYPWTAWEAEGYDGIEIWNQMSEWMEKLTRFNQLKMLFSPRKSLDSPTPRILSKWDQLNRKRKVCGIGAIDAHAHPHRIGPLKLTIFPYEVQFKSIRTHLILDGPLSLDFEKAKKQIYSALLNCNVFASNYKRGEAKGFLFYAQGKNGLARIGEEMRLEEVNYLAAQTPSTAEIRLLHNGDLISKTKGRELTYKPEEKGIYRIEAFKGDKGWIYSNHIRVV
ncbi:MAG: histidinol-phosphatase, partial [candidate division Zixibacteria bacterium]|nr:histidinol-phosphatase [candidate division Zixibacteria bacterium]